MVTLAQVAVAYDKDETVHIIIMPSRVLVCARVSLPPTPECQINNHIVKKFVNQKSGLVPRNKLNAV